jgi:SAM-dependent methyltransferase
MSYYRRQLEDWLSKLSVSAESVYDVGGSQNPVLKRTWSWKVKHYKILDLPDFDLEKIMHLADQAAYHEVADVVFCLEVFEYLVDPFTAMRNLKWLLKPGGKAYVTFAFVYPHHNELELDALRYTEPGIRRLAEKVGLKINSIAYRVDKSGVLRSFYKIDGMHPSNNYRHHDATGFIVEFEK